MSLTKLHPRLQDYVKDKWKDLTAIQKESFDPIFQLKSCTIEAPTSGGKTEAVLFPLLTRIAANKSSGFKVLYIAPLKALLNDLALRVLPYAKMCYLEAFKWHGDVSQGDKVKEMLFPSDILLTTPESIEAILLRRANWMEVFSNLETIVVDEAHYFALTERGSHLVSLLERIEKGINRNIQRIAVTATIGNPNELLRWLMGNRPGGENIYVSNKSEKERRFLIRYFNLDGHGYYSDLYKLLQNNKSIVFGRSRTGTEAIALRIHEMNAALGNRNPVNVKTHHSSVSKRLREEAEDSIKKSTESSIDAIISTSTLELGIDIGDLDQVIQIEGLNSSGSFLQRVGRTGRREGRPQNFTGFVSDAAELILLAACVSLGLKRVSEKILFPKKAFHILAHQIICLSLQKLGVSANVAWETLCGAYCFSSISRNDFDELLEYMIMEGYLRRIGNDLLITGDKTESEFLRANWKRLFAIFDTGSMYNVVDGKRVIGTLDASFASVQKLPFVFVLGGQEWFTLKIEHDLQQVVVRKNDTAIVPKWTSIASSDIPFELAQEVGRLLMNDISCDFLDIEAHNELRIQRNTYNKLNWSSDKWVTEFEVDENSVFCLWTFAGDKINRALHSLFEERFNYELKSNFSHITISSKKVDIQYKEIVDVINALRSKTATELELEVVDQIPVSWFSKFSTCLPDALARKPLSERAMDFDGLYRELKKVTLV
jgi:ATP-dependent helicase Lhr and Lhr-like helicase